MIGPPYSVSESYRGPYALFTTEELRRINAYVPVTETAILAKIHRALAYARPQPEENGRD